MRSRWFCACALLLATWSSAGAAELLPSETPINVAIDHYMRLGWTEAKVSPAPQLSSAGLVRRMTIDLAGRIPTVGETRAFVASQSPTRWTQLADRLLASPDFAFHHRNRLDLLLLASKKRDNEFRQYLLKAARDNVSWDVLFRQMMVGRESNKDEKPALAFLKARAGSLDDLTNDTSVLFFGVNVSCAKCHDHPLVDDWKQDHFYGMASFFTRTYLTKKNTLAEKFSGSIKFKTTEGKEKQARFMFLTGSEVKEPEVKKTAQQRKAEDAEVNRQKKDAKAPPAKVPDFSPRAKLVEMALRRQDREFFARAIVNRIWLRLMGRGIVDPPDQMHSANTPSHPELLRWLARDLAEHRYDLKRLIRGIILSDAYALSSRQVGDGGGPPPETFAVGSVRVMTPRQYSLSLFVASRNPDDVSSQVRSADWAKTRETLENESNDLANQIELPGDNFQVSVDEALLFSNNDRIQNNLLRNTDDRLVGHLVKMTDRQLMITTAFETMLARKPAAEEIAAFVAFLTKREKAGRVTAIQQMVWALLTSPELRFNY
tara:strand:+ start:344 stop:1978 length:1635 start_codon:yes stop_codon:yes gene_type:complete